MPKLLPLILVGGLPRAGKSSFTTHLKKSISKAAVFREEDYILGARRFNLADNPPNPLALGESSFTCEVEFVERERVRMKNLEDTRYGAQEVFKPMCNREYALNYHDNAENLLVQAMLKDVTQAAYERRAVIAESNFFCMPKFRKLFRDAALTRDHMPIYVSIFIGEDRRNSNKPLDKYLEADNTMFIRGNRRPKFGEGFVSMSAKEVLQSVRC